MRLIPRAEAKAAKEAEGEKRKAEVRATEAAIIRERRRLDRLREDYEKQEKLLDAELRLMGKTLELKQQTLLKLEADIKRAQESKEARAWEERWTQCEEREKALDYRSKLYEDREAELNQRVTDLELEEQRAKAEQESLALADQNLRARARLCDEKEAAFLTREKELQEREEEKRTMWQKQESLLQQKTSELQAMIASQKSVEAALRDDKKRLDLAYQLLESRRQALQAAMAEAKKIGITI